MPPLQPYVSNVPLQVAKNLRFLDGAGIPVTELLPIGMVGTTVNDTPVTGYISRIGAVLSDQIDLYNNVDVTLNNYGADIATLQADVIALQISGTTIPSVNGQCINGNAPILITDAVDYLISEHCDYVPVLGSVNDLNLAIAAENPATLNTEPAFSQNSVMAGLTGWETSPITVADSLKNIWLAYLDARDGISTALAAVTPTCSQVIVDFLPTYNAASGLFNFFANGYSFIPTGYTNNGSLLVITDNVGGTYTTLFDIVSYSQAGAGPLTIGISGTPLSTSVSSYTVELSSNVQNSSIGLTCSKTVIKETTVSGGTGTNCCPIIGNYTDSVSGTTIPIISGLSFTPSYVSITPKDSTTALAFLTGSGHYVDYIQGGANLVFSNGLQTTTLNIDWAAYK
jgi:hypothetical protein